MPFTPLSLPFWTVPSWNPDVNAARAAGEYPTAGWANQLQSLHDATIAKVNEVGADLDAGSTTVGVVGDTHPAGSVFTAGGDGLITATAPGTSLQVLSWDAGAPDGIAKPLLLPGAWTAVTLETGVTNGTPPLQVRFDGYDTAAVRGVVTKGSGGLIGTSPPAHRPKYARTFPLTPASATTGYQNTALVATDGQITVPASGTWHVYVRYEIASARTT